MTGAQLLMHAIYPSLRGKRVVVTGGASGIGECLVERFVQQKCKVAFVDMNEEAGRLLAARLDPPPLFRPLDLRDIDRLRIVFADISAQLGGVDILINNAANDERHRIEDISQEYWDERIATNLRHVFFAAQSVIAGMRAQRHGAIINFGSISWHRGMAGLIVYQTCKAAIEGLTRGLARELGTDGIRVNTIVPGNIATPRQAMWRDAASDAELIAQQCLKSQIEVHDVAALALFLASDDARMCTGGSFWLTAGWP